MKAVLNITRNVLVIPRISKSYFARVTLSCSRSSKKKSFRNPGLFPCPPTLSVGARAPNLHAQLLERSITLIQRINHYPEDNAISFPNTYPPDSDKSRNCSWW